LGKSTRTNNVENKGENEWPEKSGKKEPTKDSKSLGGRFL